MVALGIMGVFVSSLRGKQTPPLPVYGDVADFSLTNQLNQPVSLANLKGHIWVADIIFTRCPGPCLQMTRKMKAIHDRLPPQSPVKLLSLTADPAFDTSTVLKQYAERFQADHGRWQFLTGSKQALYDLAMKGLKLAVEENANPNPKPAEDLFIHSTRFVLVDAQGRLRGLSFEGTEERVVADILKAVDQLLKEGES
jgi:protein SCO1/2